MNEHESVFNTPEQPATPERFLSDGLDFYKLTMGQLALERYGDKHVTFTMKNRGGEHSISEYVTPDELTARFNEIIANGMSDEELAYYAGLKAQDGSARFDEPYLDFLANLQLPEVNVQIDPETNDLAISTTGNWPSVSLWETIVMSEVNELYFKNLMKEQNLDEADVWAEGDRRLDEKIAKLKARPDIKFSDFGTRRRFSAAWHNHVVGRLADELSDNFIGTSNPWFAHKYTLTPIGTYAHEMPMVYAGINEKEGGDPLDGHTKMMQDWYDRYGNDLSIALTDTFTSDFFFADFTPEQAKQWKGLRHDSGDPITFGEQAIAYYEKNNINPNTKTIVFSDGLDIDTIIALADHFKGRVQLMFGWGTTLMNDVGLRPNNIVMKAVEVDGIKTVKLSDNEGKHTGPGEQVEAYQRRVEARLGVDRVFETAGV